MNLCKSGPRSMLGTVLPERNEANLNAGPSAWLIFAGDNGDLKLPQHMPITPETHENMLLFDVRPRNCFNSLDSLEMTYDMQAGQAMIAGYFGGYTAKMQELGVLDVRRIRESLDRKIKGSATAQPSKQFQEYSKRLVKDLESKSLARTSVEGLNLSQFADKQDYLMAECVRTFSYVTFPASMLLKREEIETGKAKGRSIIAAVYHARGDGRKTFTDAPFDLLYGFRRKEHVVDLLSPFEMLRHWEMERVLPPTAASATNPTAAWTQAGLMYRAQCAKNKETPFWIAGEHYEVLPGKDRIVLPDLPALETLRHRWFWKKRRRPYVPVWSYAKVRISPVRFVSEMRISVRFPAVFAVAVDLKTEKQEHPVRFESIRF